MTEDAEHIDDVVCAIMLTDGPDGHVDGHEIITSYIMALLEGKGDLWEEKYRRGSND